jgi:hypothetical protein
MFTNEIAGMIDQLIQTAPPLFKVKAVCAEKTCESSFDDYSDAVTEAIAWYKSGFASKVNIYNPAGELIYTCRRSITQKGEPLHVSGRIRRT